MRLAQQAATVREITTNHEANVPSIMKANGVLDRPRVKGNVHTGRSPDGLVICNVRG